MMRRIAMFLIAACYGIGLLAQTAVDYEVVPRPQRIEMGRGEAFVLDGEVRILAGAGVEREAAFLSEYLEEATGLKLSVTGERRHGYRYIELGISPKVTTGEGYVLKVAPKGVSIMGRCASGVFYGIQTLRKAIGLAPQAATVLLPAVEIADAPRFIYRGMHLDCSRHFFPVSFVKKFIDLMALHNMNVFHWHLTDDQGWRIEIKKWPRLTEVGSWRSGTVVGRNSDLDDGLAHGGYYTQDEARDIVAYARERHVYVVPEIDMPGHMLAALASYPQLGCTGGPYEVGHHWGIYRDVLCVGNEEVYRFVKDVLDEVMDIFPEVVHVGGDEAPTDRWQQCPRCQDLQLADTTPQGYFTKRVFDYLAARQCRGIGWDELFENDAPRNAVIMAWRGWLGDSLCVAAAKAGHDVVLTPNTHCYFDYQQADEVESEPSLCGGLIPVEKVYGYEPMPDGLPAGARQHILGVQANLWTEYMTSGNMVEYQALPRMSALAEVQWTQPERKDYAAFRERLTRLTRLFDHYHYQYAKHLWPERRLRDRSLF